jgi:exosortase E/protease (VPEID-CTERM system)
MTFWAVHGLLDFVYPDVLHNADTRVLGTPDFQVEIFPACSGIEGIFLIAAFLVLYLWVFRKTLRFPNALILLPVGILTIWLVNAFRIALLVAVGTSVSPDIASQGFHSQAGWIGFVLVSFGLILLSHRGGFFLASRAQDHVDADSYNTRAATALLAPMLTLLAASMLAAALSWGFDWLYPAKIAVTAAVLWRFRDAYAGLGWRGSWVGVPIGALVFALWMLLEPAAGPDPTPLQLGLEELPPGLAAAWLAFRAAGSTVVIPLAEELAFRGYLLRKLVRRDFENVAPGAFTWPSFLLSSILFGLLHGRWLAGTLAGMAFALALYRRGRLADAVVAHATANALIAATALLFGYWHLWS